MNAYELTLKDQRDYNNTIGYARDLGDRNRQISTAIKMILKEYPLEEIQDVTDLSLEELSELSVKYKKEG